MDSILTEKIDMYDVWTHSTQCHTDTVWLLTFILKFSLNSNVYSPARVLQKYLHRVWTIENDEHLNDRLSVYLQSQLRLNFVRPYNNHLSQEKATIRVFHIASKGQWSPYRYVTGMQDNLPDINTIYQISYTLIDFWCAIILSAD